MEIHIQIMKNIAFIFVHINIDQITNLLTKKIVIVIFQTLDYDREGLTKLKKAAKAIHNSGNIHVENEMCLVRALERLGTVAISKEEPDIGAAFLKFSVVTKELSALMKTLVKMI